MPKSTSPRAEDVIAFVDTHVGGPCASCAAPLVGHDATLSLMLGFANGPLCVECLAAHHGRAPLAFLGSARQSVLRLACYRAGWRHADALLAAAGPWPEARIPARMRIEEDDMDADDDDEREDAEPEDAADAEHDELAADATWDAGDRGCGELALELRMRMRKLESGARFLLTTTDLGAPADIPAWCGLTGNRLVRAQPPHYLIERGD